MVKLTAILACTLPPSSTTTVTFFAGINMTQSLPMLPKLEIFDRSVPAGKDPVAVPKVVEIKISLARDADRAREFVRESAVNRVLNMYRQGYTHEDIERLWVAISDIERLDQSEKKGATAEEFDSLVTDSMVDAIFIAGTPGDCLERMLEVKDTAQQQGFGQLMFSELGPDVDEAMSLLCDEIIPAL